jgi:hypothetical protein
VRKPPPDTKDARMLRDLEERSSCLTWWLLDTGWACGGVATDARGIIRDGAPIFRKLFGQALAVIVARGRYRVERTEADDGSPIR